MPRDDGYSLKCSEVRLRLEKVSPGLLRVGSGSVSWHRAPSVYFHVSLFVTASSNGKAVPHVSVVRRASPTFAYRCGVGDGNDDPEGCQSLEGQEKNKCFPSTAAVRRALRAMRLVRAAFGV